MSIATMQLILYLIPLAGLVYGITLWVIGDKNTGGSEMACGKCGYAVRGLEALHCPECGADLREVGISRGEASLRRIQGIVMTVVCSAMLLICFGTLAYLRAPIGPPAAPALITQPQSTTPPQTPSPAPSAKESDKHEASNPIDNQSP